MVRRLFSVGALALTLVACGAVDPRAAAPQSTPPAVSAPAEREQVANPVRLRIPSLGVDAAFQELRTNEVGVLDAPEGRFDVGWWVDGPEPGEPGAAVIPGHVNFDGPGVFLDLDTLTPGAEVTVEDAAGEAHTFVITSVERFPKSEFPTDRVYSSADATGGKAEIRLVTCGGAFNESQRSYVDNVVAFGVAA